MILKSLVLNNFGLYAGRQALDFTETNAERPVILIGGLNGRGKTTILEAILLALYGKHSFSVATSKLSYPDYLERFICSANQAHDTYVELTLRMSKEQADLTIRRSWSDREKPVADVFEVHKDGMHDPYLTDNWATFIETILPAGVSQLFFFDGEKITKLANDKTDDGLKRAIQTLLGIDIIDRLTSDLNRVILKQTREDPMIIDDEEVSQLQAEVEELRHKEREIGHEIGRIRRHADEVKERRKALEEQMIREGGDLALKRQSMTEQLEQFLQSAKQLNGELIEMAAGPVPFAMVKPLLNEILMQARDEQEARKRELIAERIQSLKQDVMRVLEKDTRQTADLEEVDRVFETYLSPKDSGAILFDASPNAMRQMDLLCGSLIHSSLRQAAAAAGKKREVNAKAEELDYYIKNIHNEEAMIENREEIECLNDKQIEWNANLIDLERQRAEAAKARMDADKRLHSLEEKILEKEKGKMQEARIVRYANLSIGIMEEYRVRLLENKVSSLAQAINRRFKKLVGKQNLIKEIEIDPKTLDIVILDAHGEPFSKTKLSAGERQMLAISMLWGLASCLETQLPMIVDTPLARLDSIHRNNFVTQYLPNAGMQVIVLSTDEEINGIYSRLLEPYVASKYLLEYDPKRCETRVMSGYFGEEGQKERA